MINFTPPIKASLFVSITYCLCFQFFLTGGNERWLYPVNILFAVCSVLYVLFLNKKKPKDNMFTLLQKGLMLSSVSALLSVAGAGIILLVNYYLLPYYTGNAVINKLQQPLAFLFANSFLVNLVCGSLAAFLTAGFVNEKNYRPASKVMASVKK